MKTNQTLGAQNIFFKNRTSELPRFYELKKKHQENPRFFLKQNIWAPQIFSKSLKNHEPPRCCSSFLKIKTWRLKHQKFPRFFLKQASQFFSDSFKNKNKSPQDAVQVFSKSRHQSYRKFFQILSKTKHPSWPKFFQTFFKLKHQELLR